MTVNLTLRSVKGSDLFPSEVDANMSALAAAAELPGAGLNFKPTVGRYFTNSINGTTAAASVASIVNSCSLIPILVGFDCTVDQMAVSVATAIASATGKLGMYRSGADKRPSSVIFEESGIDFATTGIKTQNITSPVSLSRGEVVWASVRYSHAGVILAGPQQYNLLSIEQGPSSSLTAPSSKYIRNSAISFASALPSTWTYSDADLSNAICPIIGLRIAS